jgi:cytochrome c oxidase subunit IV
MANTTSNSTPQVKRLLQVFWILLGVTALEFLIAFTMNPGALKIAIFIGLTIVKAFYIVGEFMHLRHEVKSLIWSILLPMIFVVWLIVALIVESGAH